MGSEEFFSRMANIFGTLKKVVNKLKPGKIIPIHTFHPDKYSGSFSRKIVQVSDGEIFAA